jgi:hypothetical protein
MLGLILYTLVACDNSEVLPTNVDGRLADLEALTEAQAAQIAALQSQVATLESADAATRLVTLETELSVGGDPAFVSRVDALDEGLVSLDTRVNALDEDLDDRIEGATGQAVLRALSDSATSGGPSYFQRIVAASDGVDALAARADALETAVFEADETGEDGAPVSRLQDVLARLDLLEGGGTTLSGLLDVVDGRLAALETLTDMTEDTLATLQGTFEATVYQTDSAGAVVMDPLGAPVLRVDALGDFVDTLDAALATVESRVGLAETSLLSIDDELTTTDMTGDPVRVLAQLQAAVAQMVTSTQLDAALKAGDDAIWSVVGGTVEGAPTLGTNVRQAIADLRMVDQNIDPAFLEQLGNYVTVGTDGAGRPRVLVTGANLQVRACETGALAAACEGRGNVVVGENRTRGSADSPANRVGVHNIVVGDYNWYTGDGNLVAGKSNVASADYGVLVGTEGSRIDLGADDAAVVGGTNGVVLAPQGAVIGGDHLAVTDAGRTAFLPQP